jgi:hypothetical protein
MVVKANRGKKTKRAQEFFVSCENLSGLGQPDETFVQGAAGRGSRLCR